MGGSGMHNVLEPAIFKTPIIIGKNYKNFPEAKEMINRNGVISVKNSTDFNCAVNELINKKEIPCPATFFTEWAYALRLSIEESTW